jgi:hypothetical protein
MNQNGSCLCGAVNYAVRGDSIFTAKCHCRDCQKLTGSGYMFVVAFPEEAVTINGPMKIFHKRADNGQLVDERFCSECGSRLGARCDSIPGIVFMTVSSLDDPSAITPQMELYTPKAQHWDFIDQSIPNFDAMPPAE